MLDKLIEWWRGPKREYVFPIIYPGGGKLKDHHVWARDEREAMLPVRQCYGLSAFIIGPAQRT